MAMGDFSTPLRFARNDGAKEVSAVRYPLSAYHEKKDGFNEQGKASDRGASTLSVKFYSVGEFFQKQ